MALAFSKANSTSLEQQFASAVYDVSIARCRIYGQKDPDYDYSKESKSLSIKQIKETYGNIEQLVKQEKKGEKVVVNGVVARRNGISSCYLQQYDEETNNFYGIYIYGGFSNRAEFDVGNSIVMAELSRAIQFGEWAENPSCVADLRIIARKYGVEYRDIKDGGLEDDNETEFD